MGSLYAERAICCDGKTPRDFAVLGETSAALLLGAGGQIAEVPDRV